VKCGDIITLTLPMTVEKKSLDAQGIYFQRGPLLFTYAIPQQKTEDTEIYERRVLQLRPLALSGWTDLWHQRSNIHQGKKHFIK